jgi:hypothetical protein
MLSYYDEAGYLPRLESIYIERETDAKKSSHPKSLA